MQIATSASINKYLPFAVLYYFFNTVFLPHGLLYTTLLTPLFYVWTLRQGQRHILELYLLAMLPFIVAHLFIGVDLRSFIISNILLFTAYVFAVTVYTFFSRYQKLESLFNDLLVANFLMTLLALLLLFTPLSEGFWFYNKLTTGITEFPRLSMMTYEASYYATLFLPLAVFFGLKLLLGQVEKHHGWIIMMVVLPLVLSLSFGVIGSLIIAVGLLFLLNVRRLLFRKMILNIIVGILLALIICLFLLLIFYPDNVLFVRLVNIASGSDPSARGRLVDSYWFAQELMGMKNAWWGIGAGQIKVLGDEYIRAFYQYDPADIPVVRIPNAFAETLATFGIIGGVLRLALQIWLFFKTNVLGNYFRTVLFFHIFVYQFTGSYLTNVAEYVIWALAFCSCFPQFDRPKKHVL